MITITSLQEEHLKDAALLVCNRYRRLCEQVPDLPNRYTKADNVLPLLQNILSKAGAGVVAIRGNQLVGFLTGWKMASFRGKRSTYSPEWAHAAEPDDGAHIYEEMYTSLAANWFAEQYVVSYISLYPYDVEALRAWHWMGFGMISVDALRGLDAIQQSLTPKANVHIRQATWQDVDQVVELRDSLWQYMKASPVFLLTERKDQGYYQEWLRNPGKPIWLAYWNDEPVAFLQVGPADDDVCTIIQDEKTTSIYAAFTKAKARQAGIATTLLNQALKSAKEAGYKRCAVSFEPMNLLGSRFWLKYFQPVCFSVVRHLDDRLIDHK